MSGDMAELKIVTYPDPILEERTTEVDLTSGVPDDVAELARDMLDTMHVNGGAGLAANQVGRSERMLVVNGKYAGSRRAVVLINPKVTWTSDDESVVSEGCLSFPDVSVPVTRATTCVVEAYDNHGRRRTYDCRKNPLLARVILHELDHLDGMTMLDRVDDELRSAIEERFEGDSPPAA